jgi:hypothetical protein
MSRDFSEPDWKTLSHLKPLALDRLCQRILLESEDIIVRVKEGGHHSAYLELFKHIQTNDKRLSICFDDWRRSQALEILTSWKSEELLTEEEFAVFSLETREMVNFLLKRIRKG